MLGEDWGGGRGSSGWAAGSERQRPGCAEPGRGAAAASLGGQGERLGEIAAGSGGVRVRWGNNGGGGRTNGGAGVAPGCSPLQPPALQVPVPGGL